MHSRSRLALFLTALALVCAAVPFTRALADPIRYEFTGTAFSSVGPIHAGDRLHGTLFFDPAYSTIRYAQAGYAFHDLFIGSAGLEVVVESSSGPLTFANVPGYMGIEILNDFGYTGTEPPLDDFLVICQEVTRFPVYFRRLYVRMLMVVGSVSESFLDDTALPAHLRLPTQGWAYLEIEGGSNFANLDYAMYLTLDHLALANQPPDCHAAVGSIPAFIAPDGGFAPVTITGVVDPDGDPVTIAVTGVSQDEPVKDAGARPTCPDAIVAGGAAQVRMERSGTGNGRVYRVAFTASDGRGGSCEGAVTVCVPHDRGTTTCVDDGAAYSSTQGCSGAPALSATRVQTLDLAVAASHGRNLAFDFTLPEAGEVTLTVHDVAGRAVATVARGAFGSGAHRVEWKAEGQRPGIYFARLRTPSTSVVRRFAVL